MKKPPTAIRNFLIGAVASAAILAPASGRTADHNDPNAINAIFADIPPSAADLYDLFGFPSDDTSGGEKVVIALTFGAVPATGVFDTDVMYRIHVDPDPRTGPGMGDTHSLKAVFAYAEAIRKKYLESKPSEIRVSFNQNHQAKVDFLNFPGGDFSKVIATNQVTQLETPDGQAIKTFVGGRDDAFYNDLPGFFRSINYGPQYYKIPVKMADQREFPIPKTLLELEGNHLFNYDPKQPQWGISEKRVLPDGPIDWKGQRFLKDKNGNYRFVYSGKDAQAGRNVNAIVLELPMRFISTDPAKERIVRTWGESWMLKAASKAAADAATPFDDNPDHYKLVDLDGVPFLDAALNEREDDRQLANNIKLARHYTLRFAHLGWGFGPSISALGLGSCFDHDDSPVSVHKTYNWATAAFPRVKKCFFQRINMPDESWNRKGLAIQPPRTFEIFIPNVASIDMDTTGTWPFGRRLEDQVATRFLSLFLDMSGGCGGKPCNLETLGDPALWQSAPIEPKTPPNPLKNDKEFLQDFPYLAEPW